LEAPDPKEKRWGIHGVIFHDHPDKKLHFPESRRSIDVNTPHINHCEAELNQKDRQATSIAANPLQFGE
jgi:hypothetical protein